MSHHLEIARTLARAIISGEEVARATQSIWDEYRLHALYYLETKESKTLLKRFRLPVANPYIETLIRKSVGLPEKEKIENKHLQESVISALLCPLRQIVGSCFATAPAIFIQQKQPERLLLDLYDLMMLGKMKRTFGGEEFAVPLSPKWGGRETDHPLLRAWEYTLASFSDYKTTFSKWNLFESLGLDPKKEGGIGHLIYGALQEKLEAANKEVDKLHEEYVRAVDEARVAQALLRQADSPDRIRLRKGELQVRSHHANVCKEMRDEAHQKGEYIAKFFPFIIEQYTEKFQEYFLEVFDADTEEVCETLYEDSPAGFRLCYKHGRSDPSSWTLIHNAEEFIGALRQFFLAVEPQIIAASDWDEEEIASLTTAIIHFIETKEFLSFALKKKNPWSYTSGGSLHTLLKGYYCIEGEIAEEKRAIKNPTDLLIFLLDLLKSLPYHVTKPFEIDPLASLLMYSPTHAFLLKPGQPRFKEGWLDKGFTYTWVRDHVINPGKAHVVNPDLHPPEPLIFADTNWADYFFAFAVNPASLELDLYRVSADETRALPMNEWRPYLNGSSSEPWGVLTRPSDLASVAFADLALKLKKV
ncbi:hypothetical protein [Candidatus Neptunochlamydia vexilliferae]|nr:hypothetical protein [Candidatus Neptunochlamydia vexilliferae]